MGRALSLDRAQTLLIKPLAGSIDLGKVTRKLPGRLSPIFRMVFDRLNRAESD